MKYFINVFLLSFLPFISHEQINFKADLTKEKTGYGYYSYAIGNTLYYLGSAELMTTDLTTGSFKKMKWENLGGKFFNQENLGNTRFFILNSNARSNTGNLEIILAVSIKSKDFTFIKVVLDQNLILVEEKELLNIHADNYFSHKEFKTNSITGESVFIEYAKNVKGPDLIRAVFFNAEMELVSNKEFFYDIPFNNALSEFMDQLGSLFVVSDNTALFKINKGIYVVTNGEFKPFGISVDVNFRDFLIRPRENNFFTIIGYYQTEEVHGLVVLDFDDEMSQLTEDYIPLSNNLLANSEKQITKDFSSESYGNLDLIEAFIENDGSIRLFAGTVVTKKKDGIPYENNNLTLITLDDERQVDKVTTVATKSALFQSFLYTDKRIKVLFVDSPKSYDKSGLYIPNSNKKSSRESGILAELEFNKANGELISRHRLIFENTTKEITGTIVYPAIIADNPNSLILSIFRYPKNDHIIGEYK